MGFTRENFYGLDFEWYCIDSEGGVGFFTSGYAPIPSVIFDIAEDEYGTLSDRLCGMQGLYEYDEMRQGGPYQRLKIPKSPIHVNDFDKDLRRFLKRFTIRGLKFKECKTLDASLFK